MAWKVMHIFKKGYMNTDTDLLKVTGITCIQISTYAQLLENQFGTFLKPDLQGIYVVGEIYPRIVNNRKYFEYNTNIPNKSLSIITDFNLVKNAVVDEKYDLVVPKYMMADKEKYLSNTPTIPARCYILIDLIIKNHLDLVSQISNRRPNSNRILNILKDECQDVYEDGYLTRLISPLLDQVDNFIGANTWHMYFSKIVGLDIHIERTCDYRIYEYYRMINEKNSKQDIF